MRKTRVKQIIFSIILSLIICYIQVANADSLVTRDDFMCYDTTLGYPDRSVWPSVAIDAAGNLYEIDYVTLGQGFSFQQFNRFDKFGNQLQPVTVFLPDTISDSIWESVASLPIYCNDIGKVLISTKAEKDTVTLELFSRIFAYLFDENGAPHAEDPVCMLCEPEYLPYISNRPYGAINNNNVIAMVCEVYPHQNLVTKDSVLIRLYYQDIDSMSSVINAMFLPHPLLGVPNYEGKYDIFSEPAIGLADDNSFAVAWNASDYGSPYSHVFYAVFNADGTPRTDAMMADCSAGYMDTANCATENVHRLDMMMEPDGDFYIVWFESQLNSFYWVRNHIWVRGFNADGTPKYDPVRVNDADTTWLLLQQVIHPTLACDSLGNVLVFWSDARLHPDNGASQKLDVFAQKVDPTGNLVGHNMRINNIPGIAGIHGLHFDCDINDAGQAVFIWRDFAPEHRIRAQLMPYDQVGRFTPGDINADLSGNIADLTSMVRYMFKGGDDVYWPRNILDFNADSSNGNIADLTYLVNYFFKGGSAPNTPDEGIRPNMGKFNPWE